MQIESIVCPEHIEEKIESKHRVTCNEARQVFFQRPRFRFAEKGYTEGNDLYIVFGQTFGGRYLTVFFIYRTYAVSHTGKGLQAPCPSRSGVILRKS